MAALRELALQLGFSQRLGDEEVGNVSALLQALAAGRIKIENPQAAGMVTWRALAGGMVPGGEIPGPEKWLPD